MFLKFEEKKMETHKLSNSKNWSPYKPLLKTFQKSNYLTGTFWTKPVKNHIQELVLNKSVCYPNNCLVSLGIFSDQESTVLAPIFALVYKILFTFPWLSIMQTLFWNLLIVSTVKTPSTKQLVEFSYSWAKTNHIPPSLPWSNF